MDGEAGGVSKSPNVTVEDGIYLDLEDGHGGCRGLSEGGNGVRKRHEVCRLLFPIVEQKPLLQSNDLRVR
jgi:hypothetical protein